MSPVPRSHVGAILRSSAVRLAAVCDRKPEQIEEFRAQWAVDVPAFVDADDLLEAGPFDVVVVATPPETHASILRRVIAAGPRVVFCEKPFCGRADEAREIVARAEDARVGLTVNYHRRWDRKIRALRIAVASESRAVRGTACYMKGLHNYGAHVIDLASYLFGPITVVQADRRTDAQRLLADPSLSAVLGFESGFVMRLDGLDETAYEVLDIDLYFADAKYRLEFGGQRIERFVAREGVRFRGYVNLTPASETFADGPIVGLPDAYDEIVAFVDGRGDLATSPGASAVRVLEVIEAIERSAESGARIAV